MRNSSAGAYEQLRFVREGIAVRSSEPADRLTDKRHELVPGVKHHGRATGLYSSLFDERDQISSLLTPD